jgi:hypothetical protein
MLDTAPTTQTADQTEPAPANPHALAHLDAATRYYAGVVSQGGIQALVQVWPQIVALMEQLQRIERK